MASSQDASSTTTKKALPVLLSYLSSLTKSSDVGQQDIAVQQYSALLYGRASREQFWAQRSETVAPLIDILRQAAGVSNGESASLWSNTTTTARDVPAGFEGSHSGGVGLQHLYHVLRVMWQMSFAADEIGEELNE